MCGPKTLFTKSNLGTSNTREVSHQNGNTMKVFVVSHTGFLARYYFMSENGWFLTWC